MSGIDVTNKLDESFGEYASDIRVSVYADWINQIINPFPYNGNDNIIGTINNDFLYGYQGDDTIKGLEGDDNILGEKVLMISMEMKVMIPLWKFRI